MSQIVNEQFSQNLFSAPNGQKKDSPTIFDELRWATQHVEKPIEQVLQMISEFHGPWSGMNQNLMQLVAFISSVKGGANAKALTAAAKASLNSLSQLHSPPSTVGRKNNITANDMSIPLLREFVSRCQHIHPTVNNYIQQNIGKYPYFQQISNNVASMAQIVIGSAEVQLINRIKSNGLTNMDTNSRLRRSTHAKIFPPVAALIEETHTMLDVMHLRAIRAGNTSLVNSNNAIAHGHTLMPDVHNADRGKGAIQECTMKATQRFGPTLQLCDSFFPISYQVQNTPRFYELTAEGKSYTADGFNRPIVRTPVLPVATTDKKSPTP